METKLNNHKKKSGITLVELVVTIVIISLVTISVVTSIVLFRHFSYINGVNEEFSVAINSVADIIIADIDENGFTGSSKRYEDIIDKYLSKTNLCDSFEKDEIIRSVKIIDNGTAKIFNDSGTGTLSYDTMLISLEVKKDKQDEDSPSLVIAKQTIYIPQKEKTEN